jgi:hypothetical protein
MGGARHSAGKHAVPNRPNLDSLCKDLPSEDLRLEHKLQTAMKATASDAIAISLNAHGIAAKRFRQFVPAGTRTAREVSAVLILKGIDFACLNLRLRVSAPKGSKALSPPWIPYLFWEPIQRLLSASVCRMP